MSLGVVGEHDGMSERALVVGGGIGGLGRLAPSALTVRGLDGVLGWRPPD